MEGGSSTEIQSQPQIGVEPVLDARLPDKQEVIKQKPEKSVKQILFNAGFAIATALSAQFMHVLPVSASGMQGYESAPVGITLDLNAESTPGVLMGDEYNEQLPANYYGGSFSRKESQAMGAILADELVYNLPGQRTPDAWRALVDNLDASSNPRYAPREGKTYCNFYIRDALREFGVAIPVTYEDPETGQIKPTLANNIYDRLSEGSFTVNNPQGDQKEWDQIDREMAQKMADLGYPVILSVKNQSGGPGHVALVAPQGIGNREQTEWNSQNQGEGTSGDFIVSQAGGKNGILRWNETHYSKDNGYSELKIFVNAEDMKNFQEQDGQKVTWQGDENHPLPPVAVVQEQTLNQSHEVIPPLPPIQPQVLPQE